MLSENYGCPEEKCFLTVGLVLPKSPYSENGAFSCRDLAEKIAIAMSSTMTPEEKEAAFKKSDELVIRPERMHVSADLLKATWKAVLHRCTHQAQAFKAALGKPLDKKEVQNLDVIYEMIAQLNDVQFMLPQNMDTVIVGGTAKKMKNAINAHYWSIQSADESELRGKVVFGSKIKTVIYIPTEKLIYGDGAKIETAVAIIMQTLNYLDSCNNCQVIMLPVLRHLDHPEKV
uniref:Uncharacterized protein n=1 Tax=Panagrolaimus superbus TaxID=310955 RepID=A0A914Y0V2_9BILA